MSSTKCGEFADSADGLAMDSLHSKLPTYPSSIAEPSLRSDEIRSLRRVPDNRSASMPIIPTEITRCCGPLPPASMILREGSDICMADDGDISTPVATATEQGNLTVHNGPVEFIEVGGVQSSKSRTSTPTPIKCKLRVMLVLLSAVKAEGINLEPTNDVLNGFIPTFLAIIVCAAVVFLWQLQARTRERRAHDREMRRIDTGLRNAAKDVGKKRDDEQWYQLAL